MQVFEPKKPSKENDMKTNSDIYPTIQRLQKSILYPHNITHNDATDEKHESWDYDVITMPETLDEKQQINFACQSLILEKFSLIHQLDVANGLYADNGMKAWIEAMISESNRCTDLIDDGKDAVPVWPEYVEVV